MFALGVGLHPLCTPRLRQYAYGPMGICDKNSMCMAERTWRAATQINTAALLSRPICSKNEC